jgi:hypothetical protein
MNQMDLIRKLHSILPMVRKWIENLLKEHSANATPVISLSFPRLNAMLPLELLARAKAVVVNTAVPFPPLSRMGLTEFSQMENMQLAGITYKDTFFISHSHQTESLHFHELVHVVQWDRLGVDNFLLAYAVGLMQYGYQDSPLEKMAYSLQARFDSGILSGDTVRLIQKQTDDIWDMVSTLISAA